MPSSEEGRRGEASVSQRKGGVNGEKENPQKKKSIETEVQSQGFWQPERGGKGTAGQRNKRTGVVLVAHLRKDATLSWVLSKFVGA